MKNKNDEDKLGVALAKEACPLCGASIDGPIFINTKLTVGAANQVKALHGKVIGIAKEPCEKCKEAMTKGFLLVGAVQAKTDNWNNPYRSGNQWIITHEAAARLIPDEEARKKGACFIDVLDAEKLGLPEVNLEA